MFATGPPAAASGAALRVARTGHRVFTGMSELARDPAMRGYLADMVGPYGLALREEVFDEGAGHSYGDMAEPLIEALAGDPVDLLVLAYGIHDIRFGRNTATYLSSRCPGAPLAFAVCDQGIAAAFTGLRLIGAYAATGGCARALLLVAEQSAVHYELSRPAPVPDRHAAVALLFEESEEGNPVAVSQHTRVADPDSVLANEVRRLAAGRTDVTLITDRGMSTVDFAGDLMVAPEGQPYTGVWSVLSEGLPAWRAEGRLVLVAQHDPVLDYLCVAVFA